MTTSISSPLALPRRPARALAVVVLACLVGTTPRTGAAGGRDEVYETASAFKGWTVSSVEIRGLKSSFKKEIAKGLVLSGRRKFIGRKHASLYEESLAEDVRRVELFLAQRGYPYAEVAAAFRPRRDDREVKVILDVKAGPAVVIDSLAIGPALGPLARGAAEVRRLEPGSVFTDGNVKAAIARLESALRERGHARAKVDAAVVHVDSTHVKLRLEGDPGPVYRFEDLIVTGAPDDLVPLVKKTVDLKPGTVYSPAVVQDAEDYLRLLGLFGRVRLSTPEAGPETLHLHADLSRRSPWIFQVNVGYWTDDQLKVSSRWHHRNLFLGGRGIEISAAYSKFNQTGGVSLNWPGLFGPRTWGLTRVGLESEREESYNLLSTSIEFSGTYRPTLLTSFTAGISISDVSVDVKTKEAEAFLERGGLLTEISLNASRDSSNDRLYPTEGTVTWVNLEYAPQGFISKSHYVSLQGSGTAYAPVGAGVILASRVRAGAAKPLGDSKDLLPNKRFYAGGATSMRGFKRRELGPLDASGAPLGGSKEIEASLEMRFPIIWRFGGALFADTGQVWEEGEPIALSDIEAAVGPGLLIRTPIGPIRADWGYRLTDREKGQPKSVFHISIGNPY
jgi:outer membrane protein assembly factor BamA